MIFNKYFWKDASVIALSPLQVAEGMSQGLQELTEAEKQSHLNPPAPVIPVAKILEAAKTELRPLRNEILRSVEGIAMAAMAQGNQSVIDEVYAEPGGVRRLLLDITDDPALNAATTREDMEAAVLAYYADIVGSVSQELRGAFKELEK